MSQPIASMIVNIGADVADLKTGVTQANETLGNLNSGVQSLEESFGSFEDVADRVIERLAVYETLREGFSFAEEAIEGAGALEDLSAATGITADALQRLDYVGQSFGIDADTMARAVEEFSAKLANGDNNATRGVEMLGLSVQQLLAMTPDQAFESFAEAAATVSDPMDRAAIYSDVFGQRLGRLLGALGDVKGAMEAVPQGAIISDETIANAHDFDVTLAHAVTTLKAYTAEAANAAVGGAKSALSSLFSGGDVMTNLLSGTFSTAAWSQFSGVLKDVGISFDDATTSAKTNTAAVTDNAAATTTTITHAQEVANWLNSLKTATTSLTDEQKAQIEEAHELGAANTDIAKTLQINVQAVTSYVKTLTEQQKAQDALDKAIGDLDTVGESWKDTLAGIDDATVQGIKHYLEAGASQHDLAIAYGLTADQIKAVAKEVQTESALTKQANAEDKATLAELTSIWQQYDQLRATHGHTTTDTQITDIQLWRDKVIEAAQKAGAATTQFYDALDTLTKEKTADVLVDWKAIDEVLSTQTTEGLQQTADKATATYNALLKISQTTVIPDATLQQFRDASDKAQLAASTFTGLDTSMAATATTSTAASQTVASDWSQALGSVQKNVKDTIQVFATAGEASDALTDAYQKAGLFVNSAALGAVARASGVSSEGRQLYSFAEGGYGDFGSGTLAVLHGLEAIIPADKLSPLLSSAVGGGGHVFNVAITVPPGTPAQQGRQMADSLKARLQALGQRF